MSQVNDIAEQINKILNQDFESMSFDEIKMADKDLNGLFSNSHKNRLGITLTNEQVEKRNHLGFLITKEQYKNEQVRIGDIFHSSWGYDQTNTEYFKVKSISKSGKTCSVVMISYETVPGSEGFMCDSITPIPEKEVHNGELCTVRIHRSKSWNPTSKQHEEIGEIHLRGSVFYGSMDSKHLTNLYRVDPTKREYRSWYA